MGVADVKARIEGSAALDPTIGAVVASGFYDYDFMPGNPVFRPYDHREHAVYLGLLMHTHPGELAFAMSRRTGKVLVLTRSAENYTRLLHLERLRPSTVEEADTLIRQGVML
jgi:hypothetical protein